MLSGFLISYLLMVENDHSGQIHILSFYIRRALRIWPLYYFCVFFGFVIFPILKTKFGQVSNETADPVLCSFFLNNFNTIKNGPPDASVLSVLWSVAIEEQFYFVWPILFYFTPKKQYVYLFFAVILISLLYRIQNLKSDIETHTLGVISDMAIGGMGAYFVLNNKKILEYIRQSSPVFNLIPYAVFIIYLISYRWILSTPVLLAFNHVIPSFFFIWIILEQNFCERSFFKVSQLKVISKLGKYTYSLYCLHTIVVLTVVTLLKKMDLNKTSWEIICIQLPLAFIFSLVVGYLSYTYVESWFLKFKDNLHLL